MKINGLIKKFTFVAGFVILASAAGCSSKILSEGQTTTFTTPSATPEICEVFAGKWYANMYEETEDESKMICDGQPCLARNRGGVGFRLTCQNGKISGKVILSENTYGIVSNIAVPNRTPIPLEETTTPLKEGRLEDGVLYLSYTSGDANDPDCLEEFRVKLKGALLVGTYKITGCKPENSEHGKKYEELSRMKPTGGVVLEK